LHALEVAGQEIQCEETDKYASDKQTIQQNVSAIEKKVSNYIIPVTK